MGKESHLVLNFTDPAAQSVELTGGKGSSLARLTQRGFPVPRGFVVTAEACRAFMAHAGDMVTRSGVTAMTNAQERRAACSELRSALTALPLPQTLIEAVAVSLRAEPAGLSYAVRSSSTMEDLATSAFAGQHDTFLNITGIEAILARIRDCFASLWNDRAVAYRNERGFDHVDATMAVVVQRLVDCDVAGVGFSVNPVSGDLGEMIIDANFGLGESVVSGEAEVDHFEIGKSDRSVRRRVIAEKTHRTVTCKGGTEDESIPARDAGKPCLDDIQLAAVADLLARVESDAQFPQDIEWGIAGEQLYLLQSRPVTSIPPRWTRDESAERFPNVIAPLSWDFVEAGFHDSLEHSFRLMDFPPFQGKWFAQHGHYIYGNANVVALYAGRIPFTFGTLDELRAIIPRLRSEFRWVQELPVAWVRDMDGYLLRIGELGAALLGTMSERQLWAYVEEVVEHGARYFRPNIAISLTHGALYRLLHRLLVLSVGEADSRRLFDALLGWCETKTGQINGELFNLATLIRRTPALEHEIASQPSRELIQLGVLDRFPEFAQSFRTFIRNHGHREVDFDPLIAPWGEAPWVVLDNLRLILGSPMETSPSAKERDGKVAAQRAEFELFSRIPEDLHFCFHEVIRLARSYTSLDDLEHYQTTRLNLPLRRGLRELGQRLVARGVIVDPMDIFMARITQIREAVASGSDSAWATLGQAIRRQKAAYLADAAREPEWVLGQAPEAKSAGDSLTGLPGSSGEAEGSVFLVLGPDDFPKFPKGSVLVARTTNPAWTPLFYGAIAVITESGGPLSHGAVTAREMGLPAVMAVKGCLGVLKNGMRVRVDGARGRIHLLPG